MLKSIALKVTAFAGIALFAATALPVATANAALGDCPQGYFCAWSEDDATGHRAQWSGNSSNWAGQNMHDDADTIYNNGSPATYDDVRVYLDVNYGRQDICVTRGDYYDWSMDDNDYDSHKWTQSC